MDNDLFVKGPILLIGIGGAGSRVAVDASSVIGCNCLLISNDKKDLVVAGDNEKRGSIFVDTQGWINPAVYKLRHFAQLQESNIKSAIKGFHTVIVISSLAGRAGSAISPIVCKIACNMHQTIISFAIMPFGYEKDRIFHAGVSLRRIRGFSDATIIMDNDALLNNNPELLVDECYKIANQSITEVLLSIVTSTSISSQASLLCTGKNDHGSTESALRDSIAMLYGNVSGNDPVKRAMLYIMGGRKVSIGTINEFSRHIQHIFNEDKISEAVVSLGVSAATEDGNESSRVHLLATVQGGTRFDRYDPLGDIIPKENVLDWDEIDSSPEIMLPPLSRLE